VGFFSKVFKKIKKGVKSAFKSIGKGIKSAFKKIGKFMGKIGIVGQLALMFTPIGAMVGSMFSSIGGAVGKAIGTGIGKMTASSNVLVKGAGKILEAGAKFAKAGHAAFRTVTDGISSFVTEFSKTALKKIPGMTDLMPKYLGDSASDTFFAGENSAWSKVSETVTTQGAKVVEAFTQDISPLADKAVTVQTSGEVAADTTAPIGEDVTPKVTDPVEIKADSLLADPTAVNYTGDMSSLTSQSSVAVNPMTGKPYAQPTFTGTNTAGIGEVAAKQPGFFETLKEGVKEKYTEFLDGRTFTEAVKQEGAEALVEMGTEKIVDTGKLKLAETVGLVDKPEDAFIPRSQGVINVQQADEIYQSAAMNDRLLQVQLGGNNFVNSTYGMGAYQFYDQYLNKLSGTSIPLRTA
jgi:hypothetical protein